MRINIKPTFIFMLFTALLIVGCASSHEAREDYQAIGADVCKDHGGLVHIDHAGPTSVYTCGSGMTYKILIPNENPGVLQ